MLPGYAAMQAAARSWGITASFMRGPAAAAAQLQHARSVEDLNMETLSVCSNL